MRPTQFAARGASSAGAIDWKVQLGHSRHRHQGGMTVDPEARITELANLYRQARAGEDPNLMRVAEAAMTNYIAAEAQMVQVRLTQTALSKSLD